MINNYAPYIEGTIPAFTAESGLIVPYTPNIAVDVSKVSTMVLAIKNLSSRTPEAYLYAAATDWDKENHVVTFKVSKKDDKYYLSDLGGDTFKITLGQYYKVQLAYCNDQTRVTGESNYAYSSIGITKFVAGTLTITEFDANHLTYDYQGTDLLYNTELEISTNLLDRWWEREVQTVPGQYTSNQTTPKKVNGNQIFTGFASNYWQSPTNLTSFILSKNDKTITFASKYTPYGIGFDIPYFSGEYKIKCKAFCSGPNNTNGKIIIRLSYYSSTNAEGKGHPYLGGRGGPSNYQGLNTLYGTDSYEYSKEISFSIPSTGETIELKLQSIDLNTLQEDTTNSIIKDNSLEPKYIIVSFAPCADEDEGFIYTLQDISVEFINGTGKISQLSKHSTSNSTIDFDKPLLNGNAYKATLKGTTVNELELKTFDYFYQENAGDTSNLKVELDDEYGKNTFIGSVLSYKPKEEVYEVEPYADFEYFTLDGWQAFDTELWAFYELLSKYNYYCKCNNEIFPIASENPVGTWVFANDKNSKITITEGSMKIEGVDANETTNNGWTLRFYKTYPQGNYTVKTVLDENVIELIMEENITQKFKSLNQEFKSELESQSLFYTYDNNIISTQLIFNNIPPANTATNILKLTNNDYSILTSNTDYDLEFGKSYQYGLIDSDGNYVLNQESQVAYFEDMFLQDDMHLLRIKFNPKVSSFKTSIQESKQSTLGGKYPYFFRNGDEAYKEFPINGLISYHMQDVSLFGSLSAVEPSIDLTYENIAAEKEFKLAVLDWLNNGQPKLFRSPTEGNYKVRLMNVSLSPEERLGRMIHSFSATATECED